MTDESPPKIIIALDGSTISNNAADVAIEIARVESRLVEGLFIVDEPLVFDPYTDYSKELGYDKRVDSRNQLINLFKLVGLEALNRLEEKCESKEVAVTTSILLGSVSELILEKADRAQFLALGRRGNSDANNIDHLGENFRQIAHHARVPLIVGGDLVKPIKQIFLLYDGSEESTRAFKLARDLRKSLSAKLNIGLTRFEALEKDLEVIDTQFLDEVPDINDIEHLENQSISGVIDSIKNSQADMVIVGGYRRSKFIAWLIGSPIDQIMRQISLPILMA